MCHVSQLKPNCAARISPWRAGVHGGIDRITTYTRTADLLLIARPQSSCTRRLGRSRRGDESSGAECAPNEWPDTQCPTNRAVGPDDRLGEPCRHHRRPGRLTSEMKPDKNSRIIAKSSRWSSILASRPPVLACTSPGTQLASPARQQHRLRLLLPALAPEDTSPKMRLRWWPVSGQSATYWPVGPTACASRMPPSRHSSQPLHPITKGLKSDPPYAGIEHARSY